MVAAAIAASCPSQWPRWHNQAPSCLSARRATRAAAAAARRSASRGGAWLGLGLVLANPNPNPNS